MLYFNTALGTYSNDLLGAGINYISLSVIDDTDVRLVFTHDAATMGTKGNSNYLNFKDTRYLIRIDSIGYYNGPRSAEIAFINRILPDCNNVPSNSYQIAPTQINLFLPIVNE